MNLTKKQLSLLNTVRGWSQSDVLTYLNNNNLVEFAPFCEAKSVDGNALLSLSEGIVAMWRPKIDAKKLMTAIEELKINPKKYIELSNNTIKFKQPVDNENKEKQENELPQIETQITTTCDNFVLPADIKAPKSFLYCPKLKVFEIVKANPYLPMSPSADKTNLKEDFKTVNRVTDRGYYEMSTNNNDEKNNKEIEGKFAILNKDKTLVLEENCYEELNFNRVMNNKKKSGLLKRIWRQPTVKKEEIKNGEIESNWTLKLKKMPISKLGVSEPQDSTKNVKFKKYRKINDFDYDCAPNKNDNKVVCNVDEEETIMHEYQQIDNDSLSSFFELENNFYSKESNFVEADVSENEDNSNSRLKNSIDKVKIDDDNYVVNEDKYESLTFDEKNGADMDEMNLRNLFELKKYLEDEIDRNFFIDVGKYDLQSSQCNGKLAVEDYLEPRKIHKNSVEVMDNLAEEMIKLFDSSK